MIEGWMNLKIMRNSKILKKVNSMMTTMMMKIIITNWHFKDLKGPRKTQQKICLRNFLKKSKKSIWNNHKTKILKKKSKWKERS